MCGGLIDRHTWVMAVCKYLLPCPNHFRIVSEIPTPDRWGKRPLGLTHRVRIVFLGIWKWKRLARASKWTWCASGAFLAPFHGPWPRFCDDHATNSQPHHVFSISCMAFQVESGGSRNRFLVAFPRFPNAERSASLENLNHLRQTEAIRF